MFSAIKTKPCAFENVCFCLKTNSWLHPYWWFGDIWGEPGKMIIHLVSLGLSWTISSSCFSNLEKHGYSSLHPSFHRTEYTSVLMEIIWTYQEFPWASPSTLTQPEPMPQTGTWEPKMAHIHVEQGVGWGGVGWDVDGICTWPGMARFGHVVNKSLFGVTSNPQVPANIGKCMLQTLFNNC